MLDSHYSYPCLIVLLTELLMFRKQPTHYLLKDSTHTTRSPNPPTTIDITFPQGFQPISNIKKSMAQEY